MQIWYNMGIDMDQKRHMLWHTNAKVRYSAAYPTGRELMRNDEACLLTVKFLWRGCLSTGLTLKRSILRMSN